MHPWQVDILAFTKLVAVAQHSLELCLAYDATHLLLLLVVMKVVADNG